MLVLLHSGQDHGENKLDSKTRRVQKKKKICLQNDVGHRGLILFPNRLHARDLQPSSARGPVPESPPALTTWTSGPVCLLGGWRGGTETPPVECSLGSGSIAMDL